MSPPKGSPAVRSLQSPVPVCPSSGELKTCLKPYPNCGPAYGKPRVVELIIAQERAPSGKILAHETVALGPIDLAKSTWPSFDFGTCATVAPKHRGAAGSCSTVLQV